MQKQITDMPSIQSGETQSAYIAHESISKSGGTFYDAYVRVSHANPNLYRLAMMGEAREVQKMAAPESVDVAKRDDAHECLDKLARDEMAKQDVDYYEAYSLVSKRHPETYAQAVGH